MAVAVVDDDEVEVVETAEVRVRMTVVGACVFVKVDPSDTTTVVVDVVEFPAVAAATLN
jgi:hypothetical protein